MTAETCTRRPNSIWTECACTTCRTNVRRLRKQYENGYYQKPNREAAIARIRDWSSQGYSIAWIASACNVSKHWVLTVNKGTVTKPGPLLTRRVLAADIRNGSEGMCAAVGCHRRLRALAVMGWSIDDIAKHCGMSRAAVSRIRTGDAGEVWADRYHAIAKVYRELSGTRGPSILGAARARNAGWLPPAAWDDDDIDDPNATPASTMEVRVNQGRPFAHVVDDIEFLLEHNPLLTSAELAERLGYKGKSAIQHALAADRGNRPDLLARLARNAEVRAA